MSDYKSEIAERAVWKASFTLAGSASKLVKALEAEGVTFPPPPKPVIEVSDEAYQAWLDGAYGDDGTKPKDPFAGLHAAFKVMLRDALNLRYPRDIKTLTTGHLYCIATAIYRDLTGEEWPNA